MKKSKGSSKLARLRSEEDDISAEYAAELDPKKAKELRAQLDAIAIEILRMEAIIGKD